MDNYQIKNQIYQNAGYDRFGLILSIINATKIKTTNPYNTDMTKKKRPMFDNSFVLLPNCITMIDIAPAGGCNTPLYAMNVTVKEHANDVCVEMVKRNNEGYVDVYEDFNVTNGNFDSYSCTYTFLPVTIQGHQFSLRR